MINLDEILGLNPIYYNVLPAYGRKYDNEADLITDWESGLDFKIYNGPYMSIRNVPDLKARGCEAIVFHFGVPPYTQTFRLKL
jgi:hypothetical protein